MVWTSEDDVSHEGFSVALAVVTSQMLSSLCVWEGEDGTGERPQRLPPLCQCFGECIGFLTHSGILATHILPRMLFTGSSFGF